MFRRAEFSFRTRIRPEVVRKYVGDVLRTPDEWASGGCSETAALLRGCSVGERLTVSDTPVMLRVTSSRGGACVTETFHFSQAAGVTHVRYTALAALPAWACLAAPLVSLRMRRAAAAAAHRMKEHVVILEMLCLN